MTARGFEVDVILTDRTRDAGGRYVEYRSRVSVLAEDHREAECVAVQLATAIRADLDVMPLASCVVL